MGHGIEAGIDNVLTVGAKAWHSLDINLPEGTKITALEALRMADLDHPIIKRPLFFEGGTEVGSHAAISYAKREEGDVLAIVGSGYEPVQNADHAGFVDRLAGKTGVNIRTCGSLHGGRKVWFLADTGEVWDVGGTGDAVAPYVAIMNSHDGSMAFTIMPTSTRIVCNNTFSYALNQKGDKHTFRHTKNIAVNISAAAEQIERSILQLGDMKKNMDALASREMTDAEVMKFFTTAYIREYGKVETNPTTKGAKKKATMMEDRVCDWVATFKSQTCAGGSAGRTAWAAFNAVTEWADHRRGVRKTDGRTESEARVASNITGTSQAMKSRVWEQALALTA